MRLSSFTVLLFISSSVDALRFQREHAVTNPACKGMTAMESRWGKSEQCNNIPTLDNFLTRIDKAFIEKGRKLPITMRSIEKSWAHGFDTQYYRLQLAAQKIANGEDVHIMVVGGSFTAGCQNSIGEDEQHKPWPVLLEEHLRAETGRDNIKVTNLAKGGSTTASALRSMFKFKTDLPTADIVISEFNFNDGFNFGHIKHGGSMQSATKPNLEFGSAILDSSNHPAFMFMDIPDWMHPVESLNSTAREQSVHYQTGNRLHVPLVWYPTAVKDSGDMHLDLHTKAEQKKVHPKCFPAHDVVASLLYGVLRQRVHEVCEEGITQKDIPVPTLSDATTRCVVNPAYAAYADDGESKFTPVSHTSGWHFGEDHAGKPGWLAEANGDQHEIVFDILISKAVHIEYLRSYDNIGSATCNLEGSTEPLKLEGLWDTCASLSDHSVMELAKPTKKPATKRLRCKSDGGKFKILSILSC